MFTLTTKKAAEISAFAELSAKQQTIGHGSAAEYGEMRLRQEKCGI
jgi:hypothetical protein